jgi:GNAT superfamily N-acetyltransferase
VEHRRQDGYVVSDDRERVDVAHVHRWLSEESYWALGRPYEVVARAFEHSILLGCYDPQGTLVGFCRWVTDQATFAWLCDVFVDQAERGMGLGAFLVEAATKHPAVAGLRVQFLGTRDAQGLYERFGFAALEDPAHWMVRWGPGMKPAWL